MIGPGFGAHVGALLVRTILLIAAVVAVVALGVGFLLGRL